MNGNNKLSLAFSMIHYCVNSKLYLFSKNHLNSSALPTQDKIQIILIRRCDKTSHSSGKASSEATRPVTPCWLHQWPEKRDFNHALLQAWESFPLGETTRVNSMNMEDGDHYQFAEWRCQMEREKVWWQKTAYIQLLRKQLRNVWSQPSLFGSMCNVWAWHKII